MEEVEEEEAFAHLQGFVHWLEQVSVGRLSHVRQNLLKMLVHLLGEEVALFIQDQAAKPAQARWISPCS